VEAHAQHKNEIVKPLAAIMDRGFDVGCMLETITERASADKSPERLKWGEDGERRESKRKRA
jgi:hypothetical protein